MAQEAIMRRSLTFVSALVLSVLTRSAVAQGVCERTYCQFSGCTEFNLLVDTSLSHQCPQWTFFAGAHPKSDGGICSGWPNYAEFSGMYGGLGQYQKADIGGSHFTFTYTVQLENAQPDAWLEVSIYDFTSNAMPTIVDRIGGDTGDFWCQTKSIPLGAHPEWRNHLLGVRIETFTPGGATFKTTNFGLWQTTY
jgi:hypothetical protein